MQGTNNGDDTPPGMFNVINTGSGYGVTIQTAGEAGLAVSGGNVGDAGFKIDKVQHGGVITTTQGVGLVINANGGGDWTGVGGDDDGITSIGYEDKGILRVGRDNHRAPKNRNLTGTRFRLSAAKTERGLCRVPFGRNTFGIEFRPSADELEHRLIGVPLATSV